jgi:hypothetical protein
MNPDDLRRVWVCYDCNECFVFQNDKDDHIAMTGHKQLQEYDITEILGKYQEGDIQSRRYQQDEHSR